MALPAVLGAIGRLGAGAGRMAGGAGRAAMSGTAGRAGLPVAMPAQSGGGGGIMDLINKGSNLAFNFQMISGAVGQLNKALVSLPVAPLNMAVGVFNEMQAPALAFVGSLRGMRDAMGALGSSLAEFVKYVSPVHVEKFQLAWEDLTASIGKFLLPMMEYATKQTRGFADAIFTVSGPLQKMMEMVMKPLTRLMSANMSAFTAVLEALVALSEPFVAGIAIVLEGIAEAMELLSKALVDFLKSIGLATGIKKDSTGAAVRNVQIGSVEDYGRKAQTAAFRLGTGAGPEERSANSLDLIHTILQQANKDFNEWIKKLPDEIYEAIKRNIPGRETALEIIDAGERKANRVMRSIDSTHTDAVNAIEETFGVSLPSANPRKWF